MFTVYVAEFSCKNGEKFIKVGHTKSDVEKRLQDIAKLYNKKFPENKLVEFSWHILAENSDDIYFHTAIRGLNLLPARYKTKETVTNGSTEMYNYNSIYTNLKAVTNRLVEYTSVSDPVKHYVDTHFGYLLFLNPGKERHDAFYGVYLGVLKITEITNNNVLLDAANQWIENNKSYFHCGKSPAGKKAFYTITESIHNAITKQHYKSNTARNGTILASYEESLVKYIISNC